MKEVPMDILQQPDQIFSAFLTDYFKFSDSDALRRLETSLENYDRELAATRPKYLRIIKISTRRILTSKGLVTFKRRYYYDERAKAYLFLLDARMMIPKYARLSDELKVKILRAATDMSYAKASRYSCPKDSPVSASTVFRLLRKTEIKSIIPPLAFSPSRIFVQVDEKYVKFRGAHSQKPVFTATLFTGIEHLYSYRNRLEDRVIFSGLNPTALFKSINRHLLKTFRCSMDTEVILSGDLAGYIQTGPDKILVGKARYVPDRFHVQHALVQLLGITITEAVAHDDGSMDAIRDALLDGKNEQNGRLVSKLVRVLSNHREGIRSWFSPDYPGCSQECMNSHYFAARLAKKPNTFSVRSVSKLLDLLNALNNDAQIAIDTQDGFYDFDSDVALALSYPEPAKEYVTKTNYPHYLRDLFTKIGF